MNWTKKIADFLNIKRKTAEFQQLDEAILPYAVRSEVANSSPLMLIAPNGKMAEQLLGCLNTLFEALGEEFTTVLLPELPHGKLLTTLSESEFMAGLHTMVRSTPNIIILTAESFLRGVPKPEDLLNSELTIRKGSNIKFQELIEKLVEFDYDDEFEVSCSGEFSRRGGIIDIFSPVEKMPVRLDFWGDELDSIRSFSPATQRTDQAVEEYKIVSKALPSTNNEAVVADYAKFLKCHIRLIYPELAYNQIQEFGGAEKLTKFISTFNSFPATKRAEWGDLGKKSSKSRKKIEPFACFPAVAHIIRLLPDEITGGSLDLIREQLASQIRQWLDSGYKVVVGGRNEVAKEHLERWLEMFNFAPDAIDFVQATLPCGVILPNENFIFLNEKELFAANLNSRKSEMNLELPIRQRIKLDDSNILADLNIGDYAVHLSYGIARFNGLRTLVGKGSRREVMVLEFADERELYVPLYQAHLVSRYLGAAGQVSLHKLNSKKWNKDKLGAMKAVREYAADLIRMQAVRYSVKNLPLPVEGYEQIAFENSFDFELTPDQKRSIGEIKSDLASSYPMDRLLCGDVGFGKTEVAMQAAFRLVYAGYQVAVLAPTTVLAQQHFQSFQERFAEYPIRIDMVSRFRSSAEQKRILGEVALGQIDIIIGTHRLCQADIKFKNLGLVIIDEEQRFGVKHKERLRQLRADVNVLTMSATPIPRTLYLAMAGARDLSTIMTPPRARLPVKTIICDEQDMELYSTINSELMRGGQVYYLHNRVKTIEECADKLRKQFPSAKIEIGHGQMEEKELEKVMAKFINGKIDILVCTTIIESGMDVRNANTIVIERADRFGLAELYQLRGRVGRWVNQAYACLLIPKSESMTIDGRKRIAAIRRYTHLGAGFQLALRDLEIRGSGNLLGAEQSGHVNAVGFELYCHLLTNEVKQLKGEKVEFLPEVDIAIDFISFAWEAVEGQLAAALPPTYIESERLRVEAYRKLSRAKSEKELREIEAELIDRYGRLPKAVETLITVTLVRILTARAGYISVSVASTMVLFRSATGTPYRISGKLPYLSLTLSAERKLGRLVEFARKLQ